MKIAYKHLIENIETKPSIDELSAKLFQLGHEHEIENEIFDIEFTPNRGDCLSINGLLRDLSAFYNTSFSKDLYDKPINKLSFDFINKAPQHCSNISFLKIDIDEHISNYTGSLEAYFSDLKNTKNNFFTDISNFISYETGQPTHCFDASKITNALTLEYDKTECEFETLLNKTIKLSGRNLVFKSNNSVISLAGVIGGNSTACSKSTRSVIVECAYFNPEVIIGKSVKYDLHSDASYKFERGVDIGSHEFVLKRFLKVVENHANIINVEIFSENINNFLNYEILFDVNKINHILGIKLNEKEYKNYLERLGFKITNNKIIVPTYRNDVKSQNDLAEEVARSIGYDNIRPLKFLIPQNKKNIFLSKENYLKSLLTDKGFYEVINNPFISEGNKNSIKIDNPLDSNRAYMRQSLKQSLLNNLLYNERRQKDSIKLFEISDLYSLNDEISKKKVVGIIASGRQGKNYVDFSKKINNEYFSFLTDNAIFPQNIKIESISREQLDSKSKNQIIYAEIDIKNIEEPSQNSEHVINDFTKFKKYIPISEFPSSYRDLSFSIMDYSQSKKLEDILLNYKHEFLKEIFIFDYYKNNKLKEIKVGYRFIFQAQDRTITEKDVSNVINDIIKAACEVSSVSIPGL